MFAYNLISESMRLEGQSAVITGAATGIGRASALVFAREGANLMLADIAADDCRKVVDEIRSAGGTAEFQRADVSLREENEQLIDACIEAYGRIDILFCNAGMALPKELTDSSDDEIESLMDVNVKALMFASRYAIPIMLEQGSGNILFTASKTGIVAQEDSPVYCATKGAAIQLARALALDYAKKGLRVNALCPGIIDTPMVRGVARQAENPDAMWREMSEAQPMGRLGTPEECADAALWLVSDEARFVTGVALPIDGGFTAM